MLSSQRRVFGPLSPATFSCVLEPLDMMLHYIIYPTVIVQQRPLEGGWLQALCLPFYKARNYVSCLSPSLLYGSHVYLTLEIAGLHIPRHSRQLDL